MSSQFDVCFGEFLSFENDYARALEHLKRSIAAIVREGRGVENYYIGKGSGQGPIDAIYRRFDAKKTNWGLTEDWALYQSTSFSKVGRLEDELNQYFMARDPARCLNSGLGSAGRPSTQPKHFIYIALSRSCKKSFKFK